MRYAYLRGPAGRFRNPYDHGIRKNCSDFLINGYNEDLEYIEESALSEGIGMMHLSRNSGIQNGVNDHTHQINGNDHVAINVNSKGTKTKTNHGHVHSSHCSHKSNGKTDGGVPLGLGLGLGRNTPRSVVAS